MITSSFFAVIFKTAKHGVWDNTEVLKRNSKYILDANTSKKVSNGN